MGSERLQLPDFVLADLYKSSLVVTENTTQPVVERTPPVEPPVVERSPAPAPPAEKRIVKQEFLGNNEKQITILVNNDSDVYLNDIHLNFLSNILIACKLNLGDVAIVNLHRTPVDHAQLKEWTQPRYLLAFHVDPSLIRLPFTLPHYQVQQYDQCSLLFAPSLTTMEGDSKEAKLEKSKLWLSLKKMFNLS